MGRKRQLHYPQLPLLYGPLPAPDPPTLLTCWPHGCSRDTSLSIPVLPLLIFAKESSNPFSLPFSRVQYFIYQRVFREATKHENILCTIFFFFIRKSSLSQAWVTCHAVCSARAPLPSSHYLVCKESLCVHFDPKGDVGLVQFMLSLEPAF